MARNELAGWLSKQRILVPKTEVAQADMEDKIFLPPTIDNSRECKMCYAVDSCMLYRKVCCTTPSVNLLKRTKLTE